MVCDCLKPKRYYAEEIRGNDSAYAVCAAYSGHLECLKYCTTKKYRKSDRVAIEAAAAGHLDCLEHCTENDYPKHPDVSWFAVYHEYWDCVAHCLANGYIIDETTKPLIDYASMLAASHGHLACLEHCTDNGYPKHQDASFNAIVTKNWECAIHCLENGYPFTHKDSKKLTLYLQQQHAKAIFILKWLYSIQLISSKVPTAMTLFMDVFEFAGIPKCACGGDLL